MSKAHLTDHDIIHELVQGEIPSGAPERPPSSTGALIVEVPPPREYSVVLIIPLEQAPPDLRKRHVSLVSWNCVALRPHPSSCHQRRLLQPYNQSETALRGTCVACAWMRRLASVHSSVLKLAGKSLPSRGTAGVFLTITVVVLLCLGMTPPLATSAKA